ncbi:Uncharacterised protein [Dermatophilus congolensis]|uniref:Uncharacterized protein n=1 Tax=Dermatophilus congolensis TaxID=1863 RepID=A0A239VI74_9MICO|nr:hypothetical protein [Dermatophilus congolensis]SNV21459.1 Uncharacterised protein [Dermatophilus congolensis]
MTLVHTTTVSTNARAFLQSAYTDRLHIPAPVVPPVGRHRTLGSSAWRTALRELIGWATLGLWVPGLNRAANAAWRPFRTAPGRHRA